MSELGTDAIREALRPLVAELVAEEVDRRLAEHKPPEEEPPNWTVKQYAQRHHKTPAAVRAWIYRGHLPEAFKPPGSDEWLIPNEQPGGHGG